MSVYVCIREISQIIEALNDHKATLSINFNNNLL